MLGTAATPNRSLPESWVRPRYRTEHSGGFRYKVDTGTRHFDDKFCATLLYIDTRHFGKGIIPNTGGINLTQVVRKDRNTLPNFTGVFGTAATPYSSIYSGKVRYELDTGIRQIGMFGMTSISVPDTSVAAVRPPNIQRVPAYPTEHTLELFKSFMSRTLRLYLVVLTLLKPQSRCGDKPVNFKYFVPKTGLRF